MLTTSFSFRLWTLTLFASLLGVVLAACDGDDGSDGGGEVVDAGAPEASAPADSSTGPDGHALPTSTGPDGHALPTDADAPADSAADAEAGSEPAIDRIVFLEQPADATAGARFTVRVQVRDELGAPLVPAPEVTLGLGSGPAGAILLGATRVAPETGTATFDDLRIERAGQAYTLVASVPGLVATQSVSFAIAASAPSAALSTLVATPKLVDVGSSIQVTTILRDAYDNPVTGHAVALTTTGRANTLAPVAGLTDPSGAFTTAWTSTQAETKVVRLTDGGVDLRAEVRFKLPACSGPVSLPGPPAAVPSSTFGFVSADFDEDGLLDVAAILRNGQSSYELRTFVQRGSATFERRLAVPLVGQPIYGRMVATDFDGDGHQDVVLVHSSEAFLYRGAGDGSFSFSDDVASENPGQVMMADLDEDGRNEVLVFSQTNQLRVHTVDEDGVLGVGTSYPLDGTGPSAVLADFDGDGTVDITVRGLGFPAYLAVHRGVGDGTFAASVRTPRALGGEEVLAAADFDGDGRVDLALGSSAVTRVLRGNGDATFGAPFSVPMAALLPMVAADVTGDGRADLLGWQANSHRLALLPGDGAGLFGLPRYYNADVVQSPPVVADIDGDGDLDVLTYSIQSIGLLLGDGAGGLIGAEAVTSAPGANSRSMATADFDHDGSLDAAYVDVYHRLTVLFGHVAGAVPRVVTLTPPSGIFYGVVPGDIDGDGHADLLAARSKSGGAYDLHWYRGDGLGAFLSAAVQSFAGLPSQMLRGDYDGDYFDDVAVRTPQGVLLAYGSPSGLSPFVNVSGMPSTILAAGDVNDDGLDDLVASSPDGNALLARGRRERGIATSATIQMGTGAFALTVGDVNGDGRLDLVAGAAGAAGALVARVSLGNGDGTFGAASSGTILEPWGLVDMADLNSDGRADLITHYQTRGVQVLYGQADGALASPLAYGVGGQNNTFALGDFDGDGDVDMLAPSLGTSALATFRQGACLATAP